MIREGNIVNSIWAKMQASDFKKQKRLIMKIFKLKPCREIGQIKDAIKEAILEGEIANDYDEAFAFMLKKAKDLDIKKPL